TACDAGDWLHLGGSPIGCRIFPSHRANRPLEHAADSYRLRTQVKSQGAGLQGALRLCRSVSLPQIIVPCRAVITLRPELRVGDVAGYRPSIGAITLTTELNALHDGVKKPRLGWIDPILDFDDDGSAARAQCDMYLRVGDG